MRMFALFACYFWFGSEDKPIDYNLLETREINGEEIYFLKDKKQSFTGKSTSIE